MVLRVLNGGFLSPQLDLRVGRFIRAHGAFRMRQVGNVHQQGGELGGILFRQAVQLPDAVPDFAHARFNGGGVLPLLLEHADLLGGGIALGLQGLLFRLGIAARFIARQNVINKLPRVSAAGLQTRFHFFRIFSYYTDVEHNAHSLHSIPPPRKPNERTFMEKLHLQ